MITVLSFGFKYGIPADADLVFDVRFLPNPYYYENLRKLTGNDKEIQDFVMGYDMAHIFLDKLEDMIRFLVPNYVLEGKNQLVIAIGCTGGKHRSVTLAINYMSVCQIRQITASSWSIGILGRMPPEENRFRRHICPFLRK